MSCTWFSRNSFWRFFLLFGVIQGNGHTLKFTQFSSHLLVIWFSLFLSMFRAVRIFFYQLTSIALNLSFEINFWASQIRIFYDSVGEKSLEYFLFRQKQRRQAKMFFFSLPLCQQLTMSLLLEHLGFLLTLRMQQIIK